MTRTPMASRLKALPFLTPPTVTDHRNAPVNAVGLMFTVRHQDHLVTMLPYGSSPNREQRPRVVPYMSLRPTRFAHPESRKS